MPLTVLPPHVFADQLAEHVTVIEPTLAAFYTIDEAGRSVRDTPVVEAIATPEATPTVVIVGLSSGLASQKQPSTRSSLSRSSLAIKDRPDRFAGYRCERSGFYYTQSGRCVLAGNGKLRSRMRRGRREPVSRSSSAGNTRSGNAVGMAH